MASGNDILFKQPGYTVCSFNTRIKLRQFAGKIFYYNYNWLKIFAVRLF
jgi:hypothetical protein